MTALLDPEHPEAYRMIVVLRPYNSPVVVRLRLTSIGDAECVVKVGRDGGHPYILTVNRAFEVPRLDGIKFVSLLQDAKFWSEPVKKPPGPRGVPVGDESWMLECNRAGNYHVVLRAVSELGALKDPAVFLVIQLAGVDLRSLPVGPAAEK